MTGKISVIYLVIFLSRLGGVLATNRTHCKIDLKTITRGSTLPPLDDGKYYVLKLSVTKCTTQLKVDGKAEPCSCSLYYNSSACASTVKGNGKFADKQTSIPIKLRYVSLTPSNGSREKTRFQGSCNLIKCLQGTSGAPTQVSVIVAISVIAVVVLVLVAIAVIWIRKRKQRKASEAPPIREEMPNPIYQSQSPDYSFANDPNQSKARNRPIEQATYEVVGVATENNQSDQAGNGHVTTNIQPEGAVYSAVEDVHYHKETVENVLYGTRE